MTRIVTIYVQSKSDKFLASRFKLGEIQGTQMLTNTPTRKDVLRYVRVEKSFRAGLDQD